MLITYDNFDPTSYEAEHFKTSLSLAEYVRAERSDLRHGRVA